MSHTAEVAQLKATIMSNIQVAETARGITSGMPEPAVLARLRGSQPETTRALRNIMQLLTVLTAEGGAEDV